MHPTNKLYFADIADVYRVIHETQANEPQTPKVEMSKF